MFRKINCTKMTHTAFVHTLNENFIETLILLPSKKNLLVYPTLAVHSIWERLDILAWVVSGKNNLTKKFWNNQLTKGWCPQTIKWYKPYIEKWLKLCCEWNKDPIRQDLNDTTEFLTSVFHTGERYSSINTARSALSVLIEPINGLTLGKQPIIQRYMKGIFNICPSLPKYTTRGTQTLY